MLSFLKEFWVFLSHRKKLWLLPLLLTMGGLALLLVAAQSSVVAPFIYTLF